MKRITGLRCIALLFMLVAFHGRFLSFAQPTIRWIPVVYHNVVGPNSVGFTDPQRAYSNIDMLNRAYNNTLHPWDQDTPRPYSPTGIDTHIQFFLATCDVNGNPSTGIVNDPTTQLAFEMRRTTQRDTIASYASLQSYPTTKYLNIFVYAMVSGTGFCEPNSSLDAVVVIPSNFGSYPTTAHEVGHWLGLDHKDNDEYNFMYSAGLQGQTQDKICLFYDVQGADVNTYLDNHPNTRNVHTSVPFANRDDDTDADLGAYLTVYGKSDLSGVSRKVPRASAFSAKTNSQYIQTKSHLRWNGENMTFFMKRNINYLGINPPAIERAQFKSTSPVNLGVKIDGISGSGQISFQDPWYVTDESNAVQPGDYWISSSTGLNRNVFLGQGNPQGWVTPYYSTAAPDYQVLTVGNEQIPSYFVKWSHSSADLQNDFGLQSAVRFNASGATVTAQYHGHMRAASSTATGPNTQRKIGYIAGKYHAVFESMGEVWYTQSTDGSTWDREIRLSDGSGRNRQPALGPDQSWDLQSDFLSVVWESYDAADEVGSLVIRRRATGGTWSQIEQIASYATVSGGATPAITKESGLEVVVWKGADPLNQNIQGLYLWTDPAPGDYDVPSIVPGTDANSSHPCAATIAYWQYRGEFGISWSQSGEIKYKRFHFNLDADRFSMDPTESVSSGASSFQQHDYPSITFEQTSSGRPSVAWQAIHNITYISTILVRRRETGGWGTITSYSRGEDFAAPSIIPYSSSSNLTMTWYEPDNDVIHLAKYAGTWGSRIDLSPSGRCPTLGYDVSSTTSHLRVFYTSGSTPIYALGTTSQSLPKSSSSDHEILMRSATAIGDGIARTITVKGISVTKGGIRVPVSFAEVSDSLVASSPADADAFLRTEPLSIAEGSALIVDWETSSVRTDSRIPNTSEKIFHTLELTDEFGGKVLSRFPLDTSARDLGSTKLRSANLNLSGLAGKQVRARILSSPSSKVLTDWSLCVIHHDSSRSKSGLVKQSSERSVTIVPSGFELGPNFPNPFNPSTQIDFALPKDGLVSLVVYDMLGREMAQLAQGPYAAGYHSARWNAGSLASGVYYARLMVSDNLGNLAFTKVTKLLLAK